MISAFNKERISLGIHKLFTDLKSLQLNQSELKILIFCLVALIVAKGSSLLPLTYDTDDYYFSIIPIIDETRGLIWVLGHGRFGSLIIYNFLISLGIYPTYVNIFAGFLSILSLVWMGIIICRLWGINNNILLGSLVVSMITLHPYTVGIFTYKILTYTIYFNFFLAFLGLYLIRSNVVGFLVGTILIIFSISDYQLIVNFLFLTICISFTITLLNNYGNRPFKLKEVLKNSKEILQIFALSLCAFLYFIINLIVQTFAKSPMVARGRLIGFGDIPTKLNEVKDIIIRVFFENEPIFPQATKIILLYIIFIAIFSVVIRIIGRKDTIQSKVLLLALTLVLIGASIIGIVGITIPLQMSWTTPRFLSSSGIFLGGLLAIGYSGLGGKLKTILLIFAFPVLFSFIGVNNHILTDQMKINMRDTQKANRIIARLETHPDFNKIKRLTVAGGRWSYKIPLKTAYRGLNPSSFSQPWSNNWILKEISGYNFGPPTKEDYVVAKEYYQNHLHWPHPESVTVIDDLAIICLE